MKLYNDNIVSKHLDNVVFGIELAFETISRGNLPKVLSIDDYIHRELSKMKTIFSHLQYNTSLHVFRQAENMLYLANVQVKNYVTELSKFEFDSKNCAFEEYNQSTSKQINMYIKDRYFKSLG